MNTEFLLSSHAVALPATSGKAPEWIQILPAGRFSGRDGRGPYSCDPAAVAAASRERSQGLDIPIDYDHQIERAAANGKPAIAAGWITELEPRQDGLWGRVDWTERGAAHVAAREFRFVSPVFYCNKHSGEVWHVESVALTNNPNLAGLKALADRQAPGPRAGDAMSFVKTLAAIYGLAATEADEAAVEKAARAQKSALAALAEVVQSPDGNLETVLKAAQSMAAAAEKPDPAKFAPLDVVQDLRRELASLKAAQSESAARDMVKQAMSAGKITPAMEAWAKDLAAKDPAAFKAFVDVAPDARPGAKSAQTAKTTPPEGASASKALTDMEKKVCAQTGISHDDYIKARAARTADSAKEDE
jgi:phage I-like protein